MQKIKAVIFDLDGTIADTLPLCIRAFRASVEPLLNRPVSDAEIIATFGPSEEGTIMALAPHYYSKGVTDYLRFYKELHSICPTPFDGINEILHELKRKQVHITMVTGKGKQSTEISLKHFGLTEFFEVIKTGDPAGPRKAAGITAVLATLDGIQKEEVIYVGDAPTDIDAAREAGVAVIAAAWALTAEPEKLMALKPHQLFYNISDFKKWIYSNI